MNKKTIKQGFTLVELVIAIAVSSIVIGALTSFFIMSQNNYRKEQASVAEMQSIRLLGQLIDDKLRQSSQNIEIVDNGTCAEILDLEAIYIATDDTYQSEVIAKYCEVDDAIQIDGVMYVDSIKELKFVVDSADIIDGVLRKVTVKIEGVLGGTYDKVIILRY